jgi:large subunit ribosomal protein L20
MPRAKRGFKARRRRNRILKHASGFHSARSRLYAYAKEVVMKAWVYAYAHRKLKKRDFRRLWIARINAAARTNGTSYSRLMHGLKNAKVALDRKVLSDLAITDAATFAKVSELAKKTASA